MTATAPTVNGSPSAAGTGAALMLTPRTPTAAAGDPASTAPVAAGVQALSTTAATIADVAPDTGQGAWDFPADSAAIKTLALVIPPDADAGAYSSTLTFTAAPLAG